jgi:hypothetical protein
MSQPADDFIEAEVERALRPYRTVLPAADLAALEGMVRDMLQDDPTAAALVRAARPRAAPLQSGDSPAPGLTMGFRDAASAPSAPDPGTMLEPTRKRAKKG